MEKQKLIGKENYDDELMRNKKGVYYLKICYI